jgi:DNA-binding NarL/FixJ family response regulator
MDASGITSLATRITRTLRELGRPSTPRRRPDPQGLSATERAVMGLAAAGMTNVEIGAFLRVAVATVDTHLNHVKEKLNARTRKEAIAQFIGETPSAAQDEATDAEKPPIVVLHDAKVLTELELALEREGWRLERRFPDFGDAWPLPSRRVVFVGRVDEPEARAAAIRAGARGAGLVIVEPPRDDRFAEDLARLGAPTVYEKGALTPRMRLLLRAQARGQSLTQAAGELFISPATANRAMTAAREILGVATNNEAIAEFERRNGGEPLLA